ncbi:MULTISPECIES: YtzC family protein [Bacillus]|uniref:DUF2524 domain-containing protein n=2 Tax=Bacillus TaxID=1386 RepID=A0A0M4FUJ7_9BACI|nr:MULTISPECIES: YtzC family protein [Bacillus]ALC82080.1 hypothetical protein AM592_11025 [Bacillus gobiensis]MBP1083428.1 hypothetical protein [Bacillus capparidis]MED1097860.1 YtzC family protein [Bacillus capparidis]
MATRQSVEDFLAKSSEVYDSASEQYETYLKQEHFNDPEYIEAQVKLEDLVNELNKLTLSANDQQKELLYRTRLQLQSLQNQMILKKSYQK